MSNPIPASQRGLLHERDNRQCLRCGGAGAHLHHRRGRAVRDDHTHCTCNLVTLCSVCHAQVHARPSEAMGHGWIVSRGVVEPGVVLVYTFLYGWAVLNCDATYNLAIEREVCDV